MASDRRPLEALRNLIADTDLILETTPYLLISRRTGRRFAGKSPRCARSRGRPHQPGQDDTGCCARSQRRQHDGPETRGGSLPQDGVSAENPSWRQAAQAAIERLLSTHVRERVIDRPAKPLPICNGLF